ncbi:MAG: hypothetical protein H6R01_1177 [Burkholderiaceae bacterium]|nr:hypothetical protein [Burkholderiaceae bacterium]
MRHIEIIVPFAFLPASMASTLLRDLHAPALATLISRAKMPPRMPEFEPLARVLPHGAWLAWQFGLTAAIESGNSPPIATAAMQMLGITPGTGVWFILNPAHIHLGLDHAALSDLRQLSLSNAESRALFDAAKPYFDQAGKTLLYGDAGTWFVRADNWQTLRTSTPDAACGHNLLPWMPEGEHELEWRQLHNAVQMAWHKHPVNAAREQRGAETVNALWLWGAASGSLPSLPAIVPYTATYCLSGWMSAFGPFSPDNQQTCSALELTRNPPEHGLLLLDSLLPPALSNDWQQWITTFNLLENNWFAPLLEALQEHTIDRLTLHLSNDTSLITFINDRQTLHKFWIRKSLARLQS